MADPARSGHVRSPLTPLGVFSNNETASANPARVDGWHQERLALAVRGVPSGVWQGRMWGSWI
jgi:hypothetical protein